MNKSAGMTPPPGPATVTRSTAPRPSGKPARTGTATASYPAGPVRVEGLDTRLLLTLKTVATQGTFAKAAAVLGYTQSAISQQVATLEKAVGGAIFQRPGGPRPVELTALGQLVFDRATGVIMQLESLAADIGRFRAGDVGSIRIGTIESTSTGLLPLILRRLLAQHPELDTHLEERYQEHDLVELLARGELDVTFLVAEDPPGIESVELLHDPFVVVAHVDDVGPGPVGPVALSEQSLIGQRGSAYQENLIDAGLRGVGCEPHYVFRTADNGAVLSMVRAGLGMAVLPRLIVSQHDEDPRLAIRALKPSIPDRVIRLAWRRDRDLSPAAAEFRDLAVAVASELERSAPVT